MYVYSYTVVLNYTKSHIYMFDMYVYLIGNFKLSLSLSCRVLMILFMSL